MNESTNESVVTAPAAEQAPAPAPEAAPVTESKPKAKRSRDPLCTYGAFAARGPVAQLKACVRHAMQGLNKRHEIVSKANAGKTAQDAVNRCLAKNADAWALCTYSRVEHAAIAQSGRVGLSVIVEDAARLDEATGLVVKELTLRGLVASVTERDESGTAVVEARLPAPAASEPAGAEAPAVAAG